MAAKKQGRAVTKRRTRAVKGPSPMQQAMMDASGAGNEGITQAELAIPFIRLLQDLSPQVKKKNDEYVTGAISGMMIETVSKELWSAEDDGIQMIPCHRQFLVNEWVKRKHGGGFIASHPNIGVAMEECTDHDKHDLVDTHQHAVLVKYSDGEWRPAIFPMKSTMLRASREWNSMLLGRQGTFIDEEGDEQKYLLPRFSGIWLIRTAERSNEKGDFFVPKTPEHVIELEDMGEEGVEIFNRAFDFHKQCKAGETNVDYAKMDEADDDDGDDGPSY